MCAKCSGCARETFLAKRFGSGFCGYSVVSETVCGFYLSLESCIQGEVTDKRDGINALKTGVRQLGIYASVGK